MKEDVGNGSDTNPPPQIECSDRFEKRFFLLDSESVLEWDTPRTSLWIWEAAVERVLPEIREEPNSFIAVRRCPSLAEVLVLFESKERWLMEEIPCAISR